MSKHTLFSAQAANGQSDSFVNDAESRMVFASGTFGGGTVTLEAKDPVTDNWTAITGMSWTAAAAAPVSLPVGVEVRASLAGGTTPSVNLAII